MRELGGGAVCRLGLTGIVDVGSEVPRLVMLHPPINVGNEALLSGMTEQLTPRHAVYNAGADVRLEPAGHQLPAELVGDLEVLYHPGSDAVPLDLAELRHAGLVLGDRQQVEEHLDRVAEVVQLDRHLPVAATRPHQPPPQRRCNALGG